MLKAEKDFSVFIINVIANELFDGRKDVAYDYLQKTGLLSFYITTFETSHTLSKEYIVQEVRDKLQQLGIVS